MAMPSALSIRALVCLCRIPPRKIRAPASPAAPPLQPTYDEALARDVAAARAVPYGELAAARCSTPGEALRSNYRGLDVTGGYAPLARAFGFIDDAKAGVPRMSYRGVTAIAHNGCRKFLVDAELEGFLGKHS